MSTSVILVIEDHVNAEFQKVKSLFGHTVRRPREKGSNGLVINLERWSDGAMKVCGEHENG